MHRSTDTRLCSGQSMLSKLRLSKIYDSAIICEGYATGASIHEASKETVIVAFDSGNLLPVATSFREKFPSKIIIIAADDDSKPPKLPEDAHLNNGHLGNLRESSSNNIGIAKAIEAAW